MMFPMIYADIWAMHSTQEKTLWTTTNKIVKYWISLTDEDHFYVSQIIALFAASDSIVIDNLVEQSSQEVHVTEDKFFCGFQKTIKNLHLKMYSTLIDSYFLRDPKKKAFLFSTIENSPYVKKKADWAHKWISDTKTTFGEKLVVLAAVEGILFSASIPVILWLKTKDLMPGLYYNRSICNDTFVLNIELACNLFKHMIQKPPINVITHIIREAVTIEQVFLTNAIPVMVGDMDCAGNKKYTEFAADKLLACYILWLNWDVLEFLERQTDSDL